MMLHDFGRLDFQKISILRLRGLQKLFFRKLEKLRKHHFSKFELFEGQKINPPQGVNPPEILEETHTGMILYIPAASNRRKFEAETK